MDRLEEANKANLGAYPQVKKLLAPALLKNTYTVEFYHPPNNLTVCVDVVSTDKTQAVKFARERFNLKESHWELVGSDRKYNG